VIGSGRVRSSFALNCCLSKLGDVLLLDIVKGLPQGESLDISHQLAEQGNDCHVRGSNEYVDMKNSDFIVVVAGIGRKPGMTRMDLLNTNAGIVKDVCKKIARNSRDSEVMVAMNPWDPLTHLAFRTLSADNQTVMAWE